MVFNATFNNIQQYFSFIGGGNLSTWRKLQTCHRSPTNFYVVSRTPRLSGIKTHNVIGDRH